MNGWRNGSNGSISTSICFHKLSSYSLYQAALEIFFLCKNGGIESLIRFAYFAQSNRLKIWQKRNLNKVDNNTIVNRQWRTIVERIYLTDIYQNQDE